MKTAYRIQGFQQSIYSRLKELKGEIINEGTKLIDLSIGSPDMAPPEEIRKIISEASLDAQAYDYTLTRGTEQFRQACADWYKKRFDVDLDPETEILPLMGSQDGLAHIFWAYINKGDHVLIPDPGYPIYSDGLALVEGIKIPMPLLEGNSYLPDLTSIDETSAKKAKMMILNYPNNPTAATANLEFFQEVVGFAEKNDILVCHDAAYSELYFEESKPVSFLQAKGSKKVGVEFHSLSKSYNLAGVRLGFLVGNSDVIKALETVKSNIDYGTFRPILTAGTAALSSICDYVAEKNRKAYKKRRDIWIEGSAKVGWKIPSPEASMYIWAPVPTAQDSFEFVWDLAKAGVMLIPGAAFGKHGEGYVRIGLVQDEKEIERAVRIVQDFLQTRIKTEDSGIK
jgi:aspartate/methionine/tyrosine aminotransferase